MCCCQIIKYVAFAREHLWLLIQCRRLTTEIPPIGLEYAYARNMIQSVRGCDFRTEKSVSLHTHTHTRAQQLNVIQLRTSDFGIGVIVSDNKAQNCRQQKIMDLERKLAEKNTDDDCRRIDDKDFLWFFFVSNAVNLAKRIWCALSIYCFDEHKTVIKWTKFRSPTDADNRFIAVSPTERTKHHLTPYLTKLISQCASTSARWWFPAS